MFEVERTPADLSAIPANFQTNLAPNAPAPMKMMAARGMLPLPPAQNIIILYTLHSDSDEAVRTEVRKSIGDLPAQIVLPTIQALTHTGILDWLAEVRIKDAGIMEAVVGNKSTDPNTVARLARKANAQLCDIIATNQVRLLEFPVIIEQMYLNASARVATVDRLIELARRNQVPLDGIPGLQSALNSDMDIFSGGADADIFEELLAEQSKKGDSETASSEDENLTRAERERRDDTEEDDAERANTPIHALLGKMSISQKIRLATVGSREAVFLLVRDANKLVHMAAIKSPRVRAPDAIKLAKNKSLPDGVINYIANKNDWTSKYEAKVNLVSNPKTTLADSMSFLVHLRNNDLRDLQRNRNVPAQLRRQAKSLYTKRTGGEKKG